MMSSPSLPETPRTTPRGGSFLCTATTTTEIYTLSLHDALPIYATAAAGIRRQPECEMASAYQADREPHDDQGRDVEIHDPAERWKITPVLFPAGSEVGHYAPFARCEFAGTRTV